MRILKDWVSEKLVQLKIVTEDYSSQEKEKIQFEYLNNLLLQLPDLNIDNDYNLIYEIENLINLLPKDFEKLKYNIYQPKFNDLQFIVKNRFKLIPVNYHRKDFSPFSFAKIVGYIFGGITIYLASFLLKEPIFAIPFGVLIIFIVSTLTGIILDKKAQRENRVL